MNFNIFFTNSCNLNCYYCYEKEKNEKVISKKVLDQTLNFMDSVIKDNEESINVTTHGGEPFIAYDMIKYFIQEARRRFPKIQFSMTTNATLLTDEKIEFIMENYKSFAVSIDGIKKAHDANRVFKDGVCQYSCHFSFFIWTTMRLPPHHPHFLCSPFFPGSGKPFLSMSSL